MTIFGTIINLQRKLDIDAETEVIERESKNMMWVWKRKLSQKLLQNDYINIVSHGCVR